MSKLVAHDALSHVKLVVTFTLVWPGCGTVSDVVVSTAFGGVGTSGPKSVELVHIDWNMSTNA
jgi:hypothetical protein